MVINDALVLRLYTGATADTGGLLTRRRGGENDAWRELEAIAQSMGGRCATPPRKSAVYSWPASLSLLLAVRSICFALLAWLRPDVRVARSVGFACEVRFRGREALA